MIVPRHQGEHFGPSFLRSLNLVSVKPTPARMRIFELCDHVALSLKA